MFDFTPTDWAALALIWVGLLLFMVGVVRVKFDRHRRDRVTDIMQDPDFRFRSTAESTAVRYFIERRDWVSALAVLRVGR